MKHFFIINILFILLISFCSNYYIKPYEKSNVSMAKFNELVLSSVSFFDAEGNKRTNYQDYFYKGADDYELTFEMLEYFKERGGNPQVKKNVKTSINPDDGIIFLGNSKIKIYVATGDELIFRIMEK